MLALTACGKSEAPQAQAGAAAVEVGVVEVQPRKIVVTTELPGRTSPFQVAEVRPQVSGIIQQRLFKEGDDVDQDEVLYQIDDAVYQATYNSAEATLAKAEANLKSAENLAKRYAELVNTKAVSQQEYDNADAQHKQALADVAAAKAALESARINLNYTKVKSPISGRAGKSDVTPGALVVANQPAALTKVQRLDPMYVDVTQSSVDWLRLKREIESGTLKTDLNKHAAVKLRLEDGSTYSQEGVLEFSDVSVDEATGMISMRALFPNPNQDLLPGMYVRAVLEEGTNDAAILIPQKALQRTPKGEPMVLVVTAENKVERRIIAVDKEVGNEWIVRSGVNVGEKLIVEGTQKLRGADMLVKAVPATSTNVSTNAPTQQGADKKDI
jgi:membrane fusion protein (multidrug efflux system)